MLFKRENLTFDLLDEAIPLFKDHYLEISANQDIELAPDYDKYMQLDGLGLIRFFSARKDSGELMGYAVFIAQPNMHYKHSFQAVQDIIFINKEMRGQRIGAEFIAWCDEMLRADGVQIVYHHVKTAHEWGKAILVPLGYKHIENIYSRRLD